MSQTSPAAPVSLWEADAAKSILDWGSPEMPLGRRESDSALGCDPEGPAARLRGRLGCPGGRCSFQRGPGSTPSVLPREKSDLAAGLSTLHHVTHISQCESLRSERVPVGTGGSCPLLGSPSHSLSLPPSVPLSPTPLARPGRSSESRSPSRQWPPWLPGLPGQVASGVPLP